MKNHILLSILLALSTLPAQAEEAATEFNPRLAIDHKAYIDEARAHLLKERSEMVAENLAFSSLGYQYQTMPATTVECDAKGCRIVPAAPFQERLTVSFTVLDSKRQEMIDGVNNEVHDMIVVQFPTPRMPGWYINKGTSMAPIPEAPKK